MIMNKSGFTIYPAAQSQHRRKNFTIAIIVHENVHRLPMQRYAVTQLARFWARDNIRCVLVPGYRKRVQADIGFLHVDLSVIPEPYMEVAASYPVTINGAVRDITKRHISRIQVHDPEDYEGPVVVKSNLNYGGIPEKILEGYSLTPGLPTSPSDYRVYPSPVDVPKHIYSTRDAVVEKFVPERVKGLYCLRQYLFLGDREHWFRALSKVPVINSNNWVGREPIEPDPRVRQWRTALGFDYGKFDYIVHEGEPILLDANKTVGAVQVSDEARRLWEERAEGIYAFLD